MTLGYIFVDFTNSHIRYFGTPDDFIPVDVSRILATHVFPDLDDASVKLPNLVNKFLFWKFLLLNSEIC
jgi:hypothetical protein